VENALQLDPTWFDGVQVVGLTAGTSTPDLAIAEVQRRLEFWNARNKFAQPEEMQLAMSGTDP
jgi:4-hydroxy-3-methylbut-2-enyl diphosphate reductase IspH